MPHLGEVQAVAGQALRLAQAGGGGSGGSSVAGQVVVTVPALSYEHEQTVTASSVTSSMAVVASIGPHSDADENHETMLDVSALSAQSGSGQITVRVAFGEPTSGPIRVNYMAA